MKTRLKALSVICAATLFVGCGQSEHAGQDHSGQSHSGMDHSKMKHSKDNHKTSAGSTGHTTGQILSISSDGQQVTIDHGEIEGIGMGAMTMGFTVMSNIDLTHFSAKDKVAFWVKKGRDGSYRITAMCNTDSEGSDCLKTSMDHSKH